jgi:hypothetical protein
MPGFSQANGRIYWIGEACCWQSATASERSMLDLEMSENCHVMDLARHNRAARRGASSLD